MNKLILLLAILFSVSLSAQKPSMSKKLVGTLSITGTGSASLVIQEPTDSEISENNIKWKGAHGLYVYSNQASGSTIGTALITYKKGDWNDGVETADVPPDTLANPWTCEDGGFRIFDIAQTVPTFSITITIERLTGDGTVEFPIYATRVRY